MSAPSDTRAALEPYHAHFGRELEAVHADLIALHAMVEKWQRVQNLVSRETVPSIWTRHILDSLQLLPLMARAQELGSARVLDIGSGGGFPAIPLAIALKTTDARIDLIESNGRKCAFLNAAIREFGLTGTRVHNARIEAVAPEKLGEINAVTSRALAPLPLLLRYALPFFGPETVAYLHKGREFREELQQADSSFAFDVVHHKSLIDPDGVILELTHLRVL